MGLNFDFIVKYLPWYFDAAILLCSGGSMMKSKHWAKKTSSMQIMKQHLQTYTVTPPIPTTWLLKAAK